MARMYPQHLPDGVVSSAERLLYEQFAQQLPESFIVMHSVKWLMRDRKRYDRSGEIDFLIVNRELGLLVLEVKGGRIRVDGTTRQWYTKDRYDDESPIKDPFDQAQGSLFTLKSKLADAPKTRPYKYRLQHGVAVPDVVVGSQDIGLYGDRELMIDSTDLARLESAVRRIMGTPDKRDALSDDALRALIDTLEPTLELKRIGLGAQIMGAEQALLTLTQAQFAVLDALQLQPQAAIFGCAGSGKTMLAMEKTQRLANEGFTVLFTCYNKNLAQWVRMRFEQDPYTANERITVAHYHALAQEFCRKAGVTLPSNVNTLPATQQADYYNDTLPSALHEAIGKLPVRFDAIVADEGQDFTELWWVTLQALLKDPEQGIFYIFFDNNQRIYQRDIALPFSELRYPLPLNCRNTDKIHEEVLRFYRGNPKPASRGPAGLLPELVPVESGDVRGALRRVFADIFTTQRLPLRSIVVLTPRSARTSTFKEGDRIGAVTLTWDQRPGPGQVQVSSIYGFKGLEAPVVVLAELDALKVNMQNSDELLYVALSRARDHLIVLGTIPDPGLQEHALSPSQRMTVIAEDDSR